MNTATAKARVDSEPSDNASLANAATTSVERPLLATEFTHGYRDEHGVTHTSKGRILIAEKADAPDKLDVSVETLDGSPVHPRTVSRGLMGMMGKVAIGVAGLLAAGNKEADAGLIVEGTMSKAESNSIALGLEGVRLNLFRPEDVRVGVEGSGYTSASSVFSFDSASGIGMAVSSWHNFSLRGYDPLNAKLGVGDNFNTDTSWVSITDYVVVPESDLVMLFYSTDLVGAMTVQMASSQIGTWVTHAGNSGFKTVGGSLIRDGLGYGWTAPVINGTFGGFDDRYFNTTDFDPLYYGVAQNGRGLPGDSGGPVTFTLDNQLFLTGVNTAVTTFEADFGFTLYTDFTPELQGRIRDEYALRTTTAAVPEPSSLALMTAGAVIAAAGAYISKRRTDVSTQER